MTVRFATLCDAPMCTQRSAEYTSWPTCRDCDGHICPAHTVPGTLHEGDGDGPSTVICGACCVPEPDEPCRSDGTPIYPRRRLTREERQQGQADAGQDTTEEAREER